MRHFPAIAFIVLVCLTILVELYVWREVRTHGGKHRKSLSRIYSCFAASCVALLGIIIFGFAHSDDNNLHNLMWEIFTLISLLVPQLLYVVISFIGKGLSFAYRLIKGKRSIPSQATNKWGNLIGFWVGLIVFIFIWWGVIFTRNHIEVTDTQIVSSKIPESFDGFKIVQFSDAHVGTWGKDTTFISNLTDRINSLNPDLIVFTGDIVNRETSELQPFLSVLSRLKAKNGVYSVLGNHDYGNYKSWPSQEAYRANLQQLKDYQKDMGWRLLNNEYAFLKNSSDSILLIGVENWGEPPFPEYGNLSQAVASNDSTLSLTDSHFKILLTHNPEHWNREVTKVSNIDLTLSGHTHAMQMELNLFGHRWSPAQWKYPQSLGWYSRKNKIDNEPAYIYVNVGCGEVGVPMRLGTAYPEITQITLKRE